MGHIIEPDFERDRIEGQLSPVERKTLYDIARRLRPDAVFEVGTCRGGGSTYFLASALRNNSLETESTPLLWSAETNRAFYDHAVRLYGANGDLNYLKPYVNLHFGDALQHFRTLPVICEGLAFLDGAEDAEQTLEQFKFFDEHFLPGSCIAFHDWTTTKTDKVRPLLADHAVWKLYCGIDSLRIFRRRAV